MKVKEIWRIWLKLVLKGIKFRSWLISVFISTLFVFFVAELESLKLEDRLQQALSPKLEQLILVDSRLNPKVYSQDEHRSWLMEKVNEKGIGINRNTWISLVNVGQIKLLSINDVNAKNLLESDRQISFELNIDPSIHTVIVRYDESINYVLFMLFVLIFTFIVVGGLELRRMGLRP